MMIITTTHTIEGRTISAYKGIVSGEAIVGANVFKDLFASIRDFVGGRSGSYEKVLKETKEAALREMTERAMEQGADAIVGVSFDYEVIGQQGSMLMAVVTGTAVKLG